MKRNRQPITEWHIVTRFESPSLHNITTADDKTAIVPEKSRIACLVENGGPSRSMRFMAAKEMLEYVIRGRFEGSNLPAKRYNESLSEMQIHRHFLIGLVPARTFYPAHKGDDLAIATILSFSHDDSGVMRKADGLNYIVARCDTSSPFGVIDILSFPSGNHADTMPALLQALYKLEDVNPGTEIPGGWFVRDVTASNELHIELPQPVES